MNDHKQTLAYLALAAGLSLVWFSRSQVGIWLGLISAGSSLWSTVLVHGSWMRAAFTPLAGKAVVTTVGLVSGLIAAPLIANSVLATTTLLDPKAFPAAFAILTSWTTLLIWAVLLHAALLLVALLEITLSIYRAGALATRAKLKNTSILSPVGRLVGFLVLVLYLTPSFLGSINRDPTSASLIADMIVITSFVDNGQQSTLYSSVHPDLPTECLGLARRAGVREGEAFSCGVETRHCGNLSSSARIAYLSESTVAMAERLNEDDLLYELVPIRFNLVACETATRYRFTIDGQEVENAHAEQH